MFDVALVTIVDKNSRQNRAINRCGGKPRLATMLLTKPVHDACLVEIVGGYLKFNEIARGKADEPLPHISRDVGEYESSLASATRNIVPGSTATIFPSVSIGRSIGNSRCGARVDPFTRPSPNSALPIRTNDRFRLYRAESK